MSEPSPTLFPHEAISLLQICTQPVDGRPIGTLYGVIEILKRVLDCKDINLYFVVSYETGEVIELRARPYVFDWYGIEPALGCPVGLCLDAESGEYDDPAAVRATIKDDELLDTIRFSKSELSAALPLKDLAKRMGLIVDGTPEICAECAPESYRELLQRLHVGELTPPQPALNERLLQIRKENETKGQWSFGASTINLPKMASCTNSAITDSQLVSVIVEDILEHNAPYTEAVPLFAVVAAYNITFKRVSLLCSLYAENNIYRTKELKDSNVIPYSQKCLVVNKIKEAIFESFKLTEQSPPKEIGLMGEISRGYYKILSSFIAKSDLFKFMALAGERQIIEAEGLPFNYCEGAIQPLPAVHNGEGEQNVPTEVCHEYQKAAAGKALAKKKSLMAALYSAQGQPYSEICEETGLGLNNLRRSIRQGLELAIKLKLTDLTPYLEKVGRRGIKKSDDAY